MQSRFVSRRTNTLMLMGAPVRHFRKTANTDYYNKRFTTSQGKDNNYFYTAQHIHGANGAPSVSILSYLLISCLFAILDQD